MGKKCEHLQSKWTWDSVNDRPFARHCEDCGERLSLGPANDEPVEVQIGIRAAETAALVVAEDGYGESDIWAEDDRLAFTGGAWLTFTGGTWLILLNDTYWPWDVTRPVAGQYEEWLADVADDAEDGLSHGAVENDPPPDHVSPVASEETLQPFRDALARDAALSDPHGYVTPVASQFDTSDCEPDPPAGEMFDADGVSLEDRLTNAINAALSPAERTPIARIESALARLGSEHEPAEGWEERVLAQKGDK